LKFSKSKREQWDDSSLGRGNSAGEIEPSVQELGKLESDNDDDSVQEDADDNDTWSFFKGFFGCGL
jgi:hypothetical protein